LEKKIICPNANIIKLLLTNTECGITTEIFTQALENQSVVRTPFFRMLKASCCDVATIPKRSCRPQREASLLNDPSQHLVLYMFKVCCENIFGLIGFHLPEKRVNSTCRFFVLTIPAGMASIPRAQLGRSGGADLVLGAQKLRGPISAQAPAYRQTDTGVELKGPTPSNMVVFSTLPCKKHSRA